MNTSLRRPLLVAIGLLALVPLIAACGGGSTPAATATPRATSTPAATATPIATPDPNRTVKSGDTVSVDYTGTLDDGAQFDSSKGRSPLSFVVGQGQVIKGFDDAVTGMKVGDTKKVHIEPQDAYGLRRDDLVIDVPKDKAPAGLKVGDRVQLANGQSAAVVAITDQGVRIDANHDLAGKALNFEITLVSIR